MRHTLTAVFANRGGAQHALNKLLAAGFSRADAGLAIAAVPEDNADTPGSEEYGAGTPVVHSHSSSILQGLWGGAHFAGFSKADASIPYVLTLTTELESEAARAAGLVASFIWTNGDEDHGQRSPAASTAARALYPPGTEPGALQNRAVGNSHYFGSQDSESTFPLGTTFQETLFFAHEWIPSEDRQNKVGVAENHGAAVEARHDEIEALRYGKEMRNSERYRNRSWDEVDDELKSSWETRNPGASNWDALQSAIRRGWNETAPDIDEDSYYRTHWNARYAQHARVQDGHASASDEGGEASHRYQDRLGLWKAAAAHRKAAWALRHKGELPPWEKFKDALLHGWGKSKIDE